MSDSENKYKNNLFNLYFYDNVVDLAFWAKLLNIRLILFKCNSAIKIDDSVFFTLDHWAYHWLIPLDEKNSLFLIGFFENLNSKNFELSDFLENITYNKYVGVKDIIKNLDSISKLVDLYDNYIDFQHCMWIDKKVLGEFLDGVSQTTIKFQFELPENWDRPSIYKNIFIDRSTPYKKYELYLKNRGIVLDPLNPSPKETEYRISYIFLN